MLKRCVLVCLTGSLLSLAALAAEDAKPAPAETQQSAATAKPTVVTAETPPAAQKKADKKHARRDLRHCLKHASNSAIIRCAE